MRRRDLLLGLGGALAAPRFARARQAMPAIGFLGAQSADAFAPFVGAFREGLGEQGFVDGRNVAIDYRWADDHAEALPALAADLVKRGVAVIAATGGLASARAAKAATTAIPIVFNLGQDPVAAGLVASFNRPGGNLTGISFFDQDVIGKKVQLLHEMVPTATVFALLVDPNDPESLWQQKRAEDAARTVGLRLIPLKAETPDTIDAAFAAMAAQRVGGLVLAGNAFFVGRRAQLTALIARYAIPAISTGDRAYVAAGGLIAYGNDLRDVYRRNGVYVGRILKGAKPADLPIDQSDKFDMYINAATAKALGLTVPPILAAQAQEVIE